MPSDLGGGWSLDAPASATASSPDPNVTLPAGVPAGAPFVTNPDGSSTYWSRVNGRGPKVQRNTAADPARAWNPQAAMDQGEKDAEDEANDLGGGWSLSAPAPASPAPHASGHDLGGGWSLDAPTTGTGQPTAQSNIPGWLPTNPVRANVPGLGINALPSQLPPGNAPGPGPQIQAEETPPANPKYPAPVISYAGHVTPEQAMRMTPAPQTPTGAVMGGIQQLAEPVVTALPAPVSDYLAKPLVRAFTGAAAYPIKEGDAALEVPVPKLNGGMTTIPLSMVKTMANTAGGFLSAENLASMLAIGYGSEAIRAASQLPEVVAALKNAPAVQKAVDIAAAGAVPVALGAEQLHGAYQAGREAFQATDPAVRQQKAVESATSLLLAAGSAAWAYRGIRDLLPGEQGLLDSIETPGTTGQEAHEARIEKLKTMVDRGGTAPERDLAQSILQKRYGIQYGPEPGAPAETPVAAEEAAPTPSPQPPTPAAEQPTAAPVKHAAGEQYTTPDGKGIKVTSVSPAGGVIHFEVTQPNIEGSTKRSMQAGAFNEFVGLVPATEAAAQAQTSDVNAAPVAAAPVAGTTGLPNAAPEVANGALPSIPTAPSTEETAQAAPNQQPIGNEQATETGGYRVLPEEEINVGQAGNQQPLETAPVPRAEEPAGSPSALPPGNGPALLPGPGGSEPRAPVGGQPGSGGIQSAGAVEPATGAAATGAAVNTQAVPVPLHTVIAESQRQEQFQLPRDGQSPEEAFQHARDNTLTIEKKGAENGGYLLANIPTSWLSPDPTHVDEVRQDRLADIARQVRWGVPRENSGINDPIFVVDSPHLESGHLLMEPINGNNRVQYAIDNGLPTVRGYVSREAWGQMVAGEGNRTPGQAGYVGAAPVAAAPVAGQPVPALEGGPSTQNLAAAEELPSTGEPITARGETIPTQAETEAPAGETPAARTETPERPIGYVPTASILSDPARFQFKSDVGQGGVGEELKDVKGWNPLAAGTIAIWNDPADGHTYVVNGHHRLDLAKRLNVPEVAAIHIQAANATEARGIGALLNIGEGRGSAIDAAKVFRDLDIGPEDLKKRDVSVRGEKAAQGLALAKLPQDLFDQVWRGDLRPARAAIVGEMLPGRPDDQRAALEIGKKSTDEQLREMIRLQIAEQPDILESQETLFGTDQSTRSTIRERAEISNYVREELGREKRLFAAVGEQGRADRLAAAGNKIRTQDNARIAQQAAQAQEVYDKLSSTTGPVHDILSSAALQLAKGVNPNAVKQHAYDRIRKAIGELLGQGSRPGRGNAPDAGGSGEANREVQPGAGSQAPVEPSEPSSLSSRRMPGFYSQLERTIESKMPAKSNAAQIMGILNNPQNGVKQDEVKWSGLEPWLMKQGQVTKQQVMDYLKANEIQVHEVEAGNRYDSYTLRGQKPDYTELLLTLPPGEERGPKLSTDEYVRLGSLRDALGTRLHTAEETAEFDDLARRHDASMQAPGNYQSPHWREPNVLAHVRFDTRTNAKGEKILLMEEIQSDWHEAGRKKGYQNAESVQLRREADAALNAREKASKRLMPLLRAADYFGFDYGNQAAKAIAQHADWKERWDIAGVPDLAEAGDAYRDAVEKQAAAERAAGQAADRPVPAPFSKTWHELAFRRMLRWAAENGYDRLAWTTGAQQAARYDLAKRVSKIAWRPTANGEAGFLDAWDKKGAHILQREMPSDDLAEHIGKDAAQRLLAQPLDNTGTHTLEGKALSVGGHGMSGFYDAMLPQYASKLGGKWGAPVEDARIGGRSPEAESRVAALKTELADLKHELAEMTTEVKEGDRVATVGNAPSVGGYAYSTGRIYEARNVNGILTWKKVGEFGGTRSGRSDKFVRELKAEARYPWRDHVSTGRPVAADWVDSPDLRAQRAHVLRRIEEVGYAVARERAEGGDPVQVVVHSIPITPSMRESVIAGQALFNRKALAGVQRPRPNPKTGLFDPADIDRWVGASRSDLDEMEGMPVLYVNAPAMDAILRAKSQIAGGETSGNTGGIALTRSGIAHLLEEAAYARKQIAAGKGIPYDQALDAIARNVEFALKHPNFPGALPVAQHSHDIPFAQTARYLREEIDHAKQYALAEQQVRKFLPEWFWNHPLARKAAEALAHNGYARLSAEGPFAENNNAIMGMEIGVRLMRPGRYEELGLTPQEALELAEHYIDSLEEKHGERAEQIVRQTRNAFRAIERAPGRMAKESDGRAQAAEGKAPPGVSGKAVSGIGPEPARGPVDRLPYSEFAQQVASGQGRIDRSGEAPKTWAEPPRTPSASEPTPDFQLKPQTGPPEARADFLREYARMTPAERQAKWLGEFKSGGLQPPPFWLSKPRNELRPAKARPDQPALFARKAAAQDLGPGLFPTAEERQSREDATRNDTQILHDRLTAQLASGMPARPTKLKPAENRGLFEQEDPEQGGLFSRKDEKQEPAPGRPSGAAANNKPEKLPGKLAQRLTKLFAQTPPTETESSESKLGGPGSWISPQGKVVPVTGEGSIATHGQTAMKLTGAKDAITATGKLFDKGWIRVRGNNVQTGDKLQAWDGRLEKAVAQAKQSPSAETLGQVWVESPQGLANVPLHETGKFLANPQAYLRPSTLNLLKGEYGGTPASAPTIGQFKNWLQSKFGPNEDEKVNYSGLGAARSRYVPGGGLGQIEAASDEVFMKAVGTAASRAKATTMMRFGMPAMRKALEGSGVSYDELILAYIQSRLTGIRDRWNNFSEQVIGMPDKELYEAFDNHFVHLLKAIADKAGLPHDLADTAAAFITSGTQRIDPANTGLPAKTVNGYYDGLREFLAQTFSEAANKVAEVMDPAWFNSVADKIASDPKVAAAHRIYQQNFETPMAQNHAQNEGVFSNALGPLNTYYPLIAVGRETPRPFGKAKPYRKPSNPSNKFATGLSEVYDPSVAALGDRLARVLRANDKAALIDALEKEGLAQIPSKGQTTIVYKGDEYPGVLEQVSADKSVFANGKWTHIPAKQVIIPAWAHRELAPILQGTPMDPDAVKGVVNALNLVALRGPAEFLWHSKGLFGTMVSNTPYLGDSFLDKALSTNVITKSFAAMFKILSADPTTPEAMQALTEMANAGALPSKSGKITFSKQYAEETGAKLDRASLGPLLYGPKGVDTRARIAMWNIAKAANPGATPQQIYHFVNQLGNYTPELQSSIERAIKGSGWGPFATAGTTRLLNGVHAWTGTGPMPSDALGLRLWQQFTVGGFIMLAMWAALHYALTGKWPFEDKSAKLFQFPVDREHGYLGALRYSKVGVALWGKGPETGYLDYSYFNPNLERGAGLMGMKSSFQAHQMGGNLQQSIEAGLSDTINAILHPVAGPAARALFTGVTGREIYLTGLRDRQGNPGPQLMPAVPKQLKPGFLGGFAPALASGTPRKKAGFAAELGARTARAAGELNAFGNAVGENTGFLGPDKGVKGNAWLRMLIDLAFPNLVKNATTPAKGAKALHDQARAVGQ
jgi:hypothetical protein